MGHVVAPAQRLGCCDRDQRPTSDPAAAASALAAATLTTTTLALSTSAVLASTALAAAAPVAVSSFCYSGSARGHRRSSYTEAEPGS